MLHFTSRQINEIIDAIQKSHWLFIATHINHKAVPNSVMRDLIKMGFRKNQILNYPELAFHFGLLSVYMKDADVKKMSFYQLKQSLKAGKLLPLSQAEKAAVSIIEQRAIEGITGLGNRVSSNLRTIAIEGDLKQRAQFEDIIKKKAKRAVEKRQSIKEFVSEVGKQTGDWARDLDRIADYILHEAYNHGRAAAVSKKHGNQALVYGRVHKNACDSCKKIYLKNQNTGEPRIYKLETLMNNGSNIGRKKKDWRATLSPIHPWCRCDIEFIPEGYVWDPKTKSFRMKVVKQKYDFSGKSKAKIEIIKNKGK